MIEMLWDLSHSPTTMLAKIASLAVAASLWWSGCGDSPAPSPPASAARRADEGAQPKLPTIKIWLGSQEILAEQALTDGQISRGLMFRKEMAENDGMLFVFTEPHRASFWMKNTLLPLTCAYIDGRGAILETRDMKPLDESPIEAVTDQVQYVLEMNQGWFDRHKVRAGMVVRTERGSLQETYFARRKD